MSLWTAKYRPKSLKEIVGHPTAIRKITNWLKNWRADPLLLVELPSKITPVQVEDLISGFKNEFPKANISHLDSKIIVHGAQEEEKKVIAGIKEVLENNSTKGAKIISQLKALLLEGPPGVGKTALVEALAHDFDLELIEFNASDTRNQERIKALLTVTSKTRPLNEAFKGQLLLMDEVDGLAGNEDRGGAGALIKIIQQSRVPLILTANVYDKKLQTLYKYCEKIKFSKIKKDTIQKILSQIATKEGIQVDQRVLKLLAENSAGDLRAAINDLQNMARDHTHVTPQDVAPILVQRDMETTIYEAIQTIFSSTDPLDAWGATRNLEVDYRLLLFWVYENAHLWAESGKELREMYNAIARADQYLALILKEQNWKLLKHLFVEISACINVAKTSPYHWKKANFPQGMRLRKAARERQEAIVPMAQLLHESTAKVTKFTLPYLPIIFQNDQRMAAEIAIRYNFGDELIKNLAKRRHRSVLKEIKILKQQIEENRKEIEIIDSKEPQKEKKKPRSARTREKVRKTSEILKDKKEKKKQKEAVENEKENDKKPSEEKKIGSLLSLVEKEKEEAKLAKKKKKSLMDFLD